MPHLSSEPNPNHGQGQKKVTRCSTSPLLCFTNFVLQVQTKHETKGPFQRMRLRTQQRASWDRSYPALVPHPVVLGEFPLRLLLLLFNCTFSFTVVHGRHSLALSAAPSLSSPPFVLSDGERPGTRPAPLVYTSTTGRSRGAPLPPLALLPSASHTARNKGRNSSHTSR